MGGSGRLQLRLSLSWLRFQPHHLLTALRLPLCRFGQIRQVMHQGRLMIRQHDPGLHLRRGAPITARSRSESTRAAPHAPGLKASTVCTSGSEQSLAADLR